MQKDRKIPPCLGRIKAEPFSRGKYRMRSVLGKMVIQALKESPAGIEGHQLQCKEGSQEPLCFREKETGAERKTPGIGK